MADHAVLEEGRVTVLRVGGEPPQVLDGPALHVAVRSLHRGHAGQDALEQVVLVLAGHDRVRGVVLDAQPRRVDGVQDGEVSRVALRELGVEPEAVLVVVLDDEHHPGRLRVGQQGGQRLDHPTERLLGVQPGPVLAREDAAVLAAQLRRQVDHPASGLDLARAVRGFELGEVGRVAEHRHLQAAVGQRLPDLAQIARVERGEEARVELDAVEAQLLRPLDPLEEGHAALDQGREEAFGKRRQRRHPYFLSAPIVILYPSGSTTARSRMPQGWSRGSCVNVPPRALIRLARMSTSWAVVQ